MERNLKSLLDWCKDNDISLRIVEKDGLPAIEAEHDNISATYVIPTDYTLEKLGHTLWAACFATRLGVYHQSDGIFHQGGLRDSGDAIRPSDPEARDGGPEGDGLRGSGSVPPT